MTNRLSRSSGGEHLTVTFCPRLRQGSADLDMPSANVVVNRLLLPVRGETARRGPRPLQCKRRRVHRHLLIAVQSMTLSRLSWRKEERNDHMGTAENDRQVRAGLGLHLQLYARHHRGESAPPGYFAASPPLDSSGVTPGRGMVRGRRHSTADKGRFRRTSDSSAIIASMMYIHRHPAISLVLLAAALPVFSAIPEPQRRRIDQYTGAKGTYAADEDVYRVTFPRTDVKVAVEGRSMHPFLGLTSWAAFTPDAHGGLMVVGIWSCSKTR